MAEDSIREAWALAYAQQSASDFAVFRLLNATTEYPRCHALHYLQMATEKIAKAYRFRDTDTSIAPLLTKHTAFSKFFQNFLKSPEIKKRYGGREAQLRETIKACTKLAREVEQLAPAVDRSESPENAEYPWIHGDQIITPCEHSYPNLSLLNAPSGRKFLVLIEIAIRDFSEIRIR